MSLESALVRAVVGTVAVVSVSVVICKAADTAIALRKIKHDIADTPEPRKANKSDERKD